MKRNKSALYLLPTFYRQVSDAIIIMIVMGCLIISMDTIICAKSNGAFQFLWAFSAAIAYIGMSYCLYKYIPTMMKKGSKDDYTILSIIGYVLYLYALSPICLYIYVEQQWGLFEKYGSDCLFLFNTYTNWLLPSSIVLMASVTYWLITLLIQQRSKTFCKLEKKKKSIYE